MQILNIWKGFEAFESKFKPFESDSKRSYANPNHSKGIHGIRMQIRTTRKRFEGLLSVERVVSWKYAKRSLLVRQIFATCDYVMLTWEKIPGSPRFSVLQA